MTYLLDTHALIWWLADADELSKKARNAIKQKNSEVLVSAASAWEIATKYRLGKLPGVEPLIEGFRAYIEAERFVGLDITLEDAHRAGTLAGAHRDPFDRMLIAQTQARNCVLISNERLFDDYAIRRLW